MCFYGRKYMFFFRSDVFIEKNNPCLHPVMKAGIIDIQKISSVTLFSARFKAEFIT